MKDISEWVIHPMKFIAILCLICLSIDITIRLSKRNSRPEDFEEPGVFKEFQYRSNKDTITFMEADTVFFDMIDSTFSGDAILSVTLYSLVGDPNLRFSCDEWGYQENQWVQTMTSFTTKCKQEAKFSVYGGRHRVIIKGITNPAGNQITSYFFNFKAVRSK